MTESPLSELLVRPVTQEDMADLTDLLQASSLPLAGLGAAQLWGLEEGACLLGCVGFERYGEVALLRSLTVAARVQGRGYGRGLMDFVVQQAKLEGVCCVYGLTTTIPDWLLRLGFDEISRDRLPEALFASEELRGACPASARAFFRQLAAEA